MAATRIRVRLASSRLSPVLAVFLPLVLAGCLVRPTRGGNTAHAPASETTPPSGAGWHCFKTFSSDGKKHSTCYRDGAECAKHSAASHGTTGGSTTHQTVSKATECAPATEAFCSTQYWDVPGADPTRTACALSLADCSADFTSSEGLTKQSDCLAVP